MMFKKLSGITVLLLLLTACVTQPLQQPSPAPYPDEPDLDEIERLATASYENAQWHESEKHYSNLIESGSDKALNWLRLGNIYARTERPEAAIIAYREALQRDPELADAWYNMGIVQLQQAAHSFNQMQIHIDPEIASTKQAQKLLDGILELILDHNNQ